DRPDEQRGDSRGDGLLRPRERSVPGHEQQAAEYERGTDLSSADSISCAVATWKRYREENAAGDEVPDRHREEWWKVPDHDRERDEGRAPDQVDGHEGEPDPHVATRTHSRIVPVAEHQLKSACRPCQSRALIELRRLRGWRAGNAMIGRPR